MTASPLALLLQKAKRTREAAAHTERLLDDEVVATEEERVRAMKWLYAEAISLQAALDEVLNP